MNDDDRVEIAPSLSQSQFLRFALNALGLSAMKWAAFLGAFILFGSAVWWPDWRRLSAACAFALVVYVPMVYMRGRKS